MTKTDRLIIEIEYDHSPVHFSDAEMEDAVDSYAKRILLALQDVHNPLYTHFMAMARIEAKNIVRQSNVTK